MVCQARRAGMVREQARDAGRGSGPEAGPLAGAGLRGRGPGQVVELGRLVDAVQVVLAVRVRPGRRTRALRLRRRPADPALGGQVGQVVPVQVVRVRQADRAQPGRRQTAVDLVKVLPDQLLLLVGDLAPVRPAGVLQAGVVQPVGAGRAGGAALRAAPGGPGAGQQFAHRLLGGQLVERGQVHIRAPGLVLVGEVQVHYGNLHRGLVDGPRLVRVNLDLDRAAAQLRVLVDHDAGQAAVLDDELAGEVAELDRLLTHEGASCQLGRCCALRVAHLAGPGPAVSNTRSS